MDSVDTPSQDAPSWRVLIVDDNVDGAYLMAAMMQMYGHQTRIAYTGQSALDTMVEFQPDFVMLDISLPDIDGYEIARRIRQNTQFKDVKLIAATGYGLESDRQKSKEAGFDHHLLKPMEPDKLPHILEKLARQSEA
jgi:two-component system, sensor histidine kinase